MVGQIIDKKSVGTGIVKWTVDKLKVAYLNLPNRELGHRLQKILDWGVNKNFFMLTNAIHPTFGLQGKSKARLATFMSNGMIYVYLDAKHYDGGSKERDGLIAELKKLQLLDENLESQKVISGRNLTKKPS